MAQEVELLGKLYKFYSNRYKGKELETKFNDAVYDLVRTGDVKKATYLEFCIDNDIEPFVEVKAPTPAPAPSPTIRRYNDDGCGGGGRGYRQSYC